jgi:hypothetical protein
MSNFRAILNNYILRLPTCNSPVNSNLTRFFMYQSIGTHGIITSTQYIYYIGCTYNIAKQSVCTYNLPQLRQHHNFDNTTTSTTPQLRQHHNFDNTTTSTTPQLRQHHNFDHTTTSTTPHLRQHHNFDHTTSHLHLQVKSVQGEVGQWSSMDTVGILLHCCHLKVNVHCCSIFDKKIPDQMA